jgi:hypothetical protein
MRYGKIDFLYRNILNYNNIDLNWIFVITRCVVVGNEGKRFAFFALQREESN